MDGKKTEAVKENHVIREKGRKAKESEEKNGKRTKDNQKRKRKKGIFIKFVYVCISYIEPDKYIACSMISPFSRYLL